MYSFVFKLICVSVICFNSVQGCHYGEYKTPGRKKRSTDVALYDSTSLIIWFTNCMKRTSAASTNDWYSATAWTIADSNWFFYTENKHCKDSSTNTQETECWISKVNSFFHDPVATTVKTCIYEYQRETAKSGVAPATLVLKSGGRKRRQSGVTPTFLPTSPPVCPVVNFTNYENGLALQVPPDSRTDLPPNENFDLYSVSQFLRNNTSCSECETYRPRNVPASECWAQHFSQQTRDLSTVKFPVQRVNARYADGGDIVGACRGNFFWTKWYNTDDPDSDDGDKELLRTVLLRQRTMVCETPTGIQARVVQGDLPYGKANQNIQISPNLGLICYNNEQTDGRCKDYRVRYCCSPGVGRCPLRYGWSPFFDHSNTSAYGDSEVLEQLRVSYPGRICETPVAIGAETTAGKPYQSSGNIVKISPTFGLQCRNRDQINIRCNDFKVRFCCSDVVGSCPQSTHQWSQWFNDGTTAAGDDETLVRIRQSNPGLCSNPTAIQAQVNHTSMPYVTGGNRLRVEPQFGLACRNDLQNSGSLCSNYKVRFCCGPTVITTTETTTTTTQEATTATREATTATSAAISSLVSTLRRYFLMLYNYLRNLAK